MKVIRKTKDMKEFSEIAREKGKKIGFVPTMGYLHKGHIKLIRKSKRENDITVVSIFVNPTQFGPGEDYDRYPRDERRDLRICEQEKVDAVFLPTLSEIYPDGYETYVEVVELQKPLCGVSRPTHFRGVATVVSKLFNIVKPHNAYFGLKDYQQYLIVKKLCRDLNFDVRIRAVETARDNDGLATSSRNEYLSAEDRKKAVAIPLSLLLALKVVLSDGIKSTKVIEKIGRDFLKKSGVRPDYFEIRDAHTLKRKEVAEGDFVIAVAGYVGKARLIDNIIVINHKGDHKGHKSIKFKNLPVIKDRSSIKDMIEMASKNNNAREVKVSALVEDILRFADELKNRKRKTKKENKTEKGGRKKGG